MDARQISWYYWFSSIKLRYYLLYNGLFSSVKATESSCVAYCKCGCEDTDIRLKLCSLGVSAHWTSNLRQQTPSIDVLWPFEQMTTLHKTTACVKGRNAKSLKHQYPPLAPCLPADTKVKMWVVKLLTSNFFKMLLKFIKCFTALCWSQIFLYHVTEHFLGDWVEISQTKRGPMGNDQWRHKSLCFLPIRPKATGSLCTERTGSNVVLRLKPATLRHWLPAERPPGAPSFPSMCRLVISGMNRPLRPVGSVIGQLIASGLLDNVLRCPCC